MICSQCCGKSRHIVQCPRTCEYLTPILKDHGQLPEIRKAYRSPSPGSVVLWFEYRDSLGKWHFYSPLVDLWKAGFKDSSGQRDLTEKNYLENLNLYKLQLGLIKIPWKQALYLLKSGMWIRNELQQPYPSSFRRFKDILVGLDEIEVKGSVYKCYQCETGNLSDKAVQLIQKYTLEDINSGIIGQEGEKILHFLCDACSSGYNDTGWEFDLYCEDESAQPNRYLNNEIHDIIETQLRENNPPQTNETLQRLLKNGYTRNEAFDLIGSVVMCEIYDVLKEEKPFNEQHFVKALNNLK